MFTIFIDSGTTNSRIRLVKENDTEIIDTRKVKIGVRNTAIEGSNTRLKKEITSAIADVLERNGLTPKEIKYVVASGMITSNLGLYEIPHVTAPARLEDFSWNSKIVNDSEEFLNIPCLFIPGMKNTPNRFSEENLSTIDTLDMMRGEEVEAIGLLKQSEPTGKGLMILPGSHTKFILVDKDRAFLSSSSTLGGEMIHAIQSGTILSSSVGDELLQKVNPAVLLEGFKAGKDAGLTRSFYHIRLLDLFSELGANDRANYLVGIVLSSDIQALDKYMNDEESIDWVIVGGSRPLRSSFVHILQHVYPQMDVIEADDRQVECASILGGQEVAKRMELA